MVDLQLFFTIASIAIGFVASVCFCVGAATNTHENIALSSATIVGGNPAQIKAMSAQRAQYIVGALLLIFSFGLQAAAILTPKDIPTHVPPFFQSPLLLLLVVLLVSSVIAFLAISHITKGTGKAALAHLHSLIAQQNERQQTRRQKGPG